MLHGSKDKNQVHYHGEGLKNLALGIGIGAVLAWLFTTEEGEKLRKKFLEEGDVAEKIKEFLEQHSHQASPVAESQPQSMPVEPLQAAPINHVYAQQPTSIPIQTIAVVAEEPVSMPEPLPTQSMIDSYQQAAMPEPVTQTPVSYEQASSLITMAPEPYNEEPPLTEADLQQVEIIETSAPSSTVRSSSPRRFFRRVR